MFYRTHQQGHEQEGNSEIDVDKEDSSTVPTQEVVGDLLSVFNNTEPRTEAQQQQQQQQQRPTPSSRSPPGTRKAKDTPSSSSTVHRTRQNEDRAQRTQQNKLSEARKTATRYFDFDAAYNASNTPNSGKRKRKRNPATPSHPAGTEENPVNLNLPINTKEALGNLPNHTGTAFSQESNHSTDVLSQTSPAHPFTHRPPSPRSDSEASEDSEERKAWRSE